jgi:hypothetical protein
VFANPVPKLINANGLNLALKVSDSALVKINQFSILAESVDCAGGD